MTDDDELDWILNKNWEEADPIHTKADGIQHLGYRSLTEMAADTKRKSEAE